MDRQPWTLPGSPWKTESEFWSYVRGGIRRSLWDILPTKTNFIKLMRVRVKNPNPNGRQDEVWGGECSLCGVKLLQKEMEVDHKTGNHSLKCKDDIAPFIENILFATYDDLQILCKPCHRAKSYADRMGTTFEEAAVEKKVIEICKMKAKDINEWLIERGYEGKLPTNQKQRRELVKGVLQNERQT